MGFKNNIVETVVTDPTVSFALMDEDREAIFREYEKLTELYLNTPGAGKKFEFFHFNVDLNQGPCVVKRVSGCGAGTEYVAVSLRKETSIPATNS
jgi:uncharacterized protein